MNLLQLFFIMQIYQAHQLMGRVLIFDLGGGTFDISIANVKGKKVDVITSVGDNKFGWKAF